MCNPRRMEVRLTREVVQTWTEEISRAAQGSTTVDGEASATLPLTQDFADDLHAAFLSALGADDQWILGSDGSSTLDVPDGTARYDPSTGELTLHVARTAEVRAAVTGTRTVTDEQRTVLEALGQGRARTAQDARRLAEQDAQARLDAGQEAERQRLARRAQHQVRSVLGTAGAALERDLAAELQDRLRSTAAARQADLQRETEQRLEAIRAVAMESINRAVVVAVRSTVATFATENRGSVTHEDENDGILEMQLEWER
ncbi:hypothetical protein ACWEOZ_12330 [Actinoplanes sp. NPDC004185]